MRVTELTEPHHLQPMAAEWSALLSRSGNDTLFLTWEWVTAYCRHMGRDQTPFVLLVRDDDGQLRGIAPFTLRRGRVLLRRVFLEVIGQRSSYYGGVITDPAAAADVYRAVVRHILDNHKRWSLVNFLHLADDAAFTAELMRQAGEHGYRCVHGINDPCKVVRLPGSFDEYLAGMSKSMAKKISYCRRSLFHDHAVELITPTDEASMRSIWDTFIALHEGRIHNKGRATVLSQKDFRAFYLDVAAAAYAQGNLRLVALKLGEEIAAVLFGVVRGDTFSFMNIGYKEYSKYSLGLLLPALCIERSIAEGLKRFDFLGGGGAYKAQLGGRDRGGIRVQIMSRVIAPEMAVRASLSNLVGRLRNRNSSPLKQPAWKATS